MKRSLLATLGWLLLIVISSLLLARCSKVPYPWVTSNVKEGRHDFDLDFYKGLTYATSIRVHVRFTEETKYELCCGDQWDWNKGIGIMTSPHPHYGMGGIGWRYNPHTGMFEMGHYVHQKNGETIHMGGNFAISVYPEQEFWYQIEDRLLWWRYSYSNGVSYDVPKDHTSPDIKKLSGWWFGGNQAAPKPLTLYWYLD